MNPLHQPAPTNQFAEEQPQLGACARLACGVGARDAVWCGLQAGSCLAQLYGESCPGQWGRLTGGRREAAH